MSLMLEYPEGVLGLVVSRLGLIVPVLEMLGCLRRRGCGRSMYQPPNG